MDQISEIKQKLDIVDLIGGYVSLKKSGRNYKGLCPFHTENTPSFMVSPELQIFKCFGCDISGDVIKFIQQIEGLDFPQALEQLAEKAGVKLERNYNDIDTERKKTIFEVNHLAAEFYRYILVKHPSGKKALEYLRSKRKLTDDTINSFKIGYAPKSWDILYKALVKKGYKEQDLLASGVIVSRKSGQGCIDKFVDRIIFPLTGIDGKIVGFTGRTLTSIEPKYLNTNETIVFQKSSFVYGLDKARLSLKKDGVVFVEGQVDVISAHQAGFTNVVASSGTSLTENQLRLIGRYTKDIIFCFDSDTAGQAALLRAIELTERQNFNVRIALIPRGYKDIDELIKSDEEEASNVFKNAIPAYDYIFISAVKGNDQTSSIGKKKIIEELVPVFSKITNKVLLDHYIKKISEELNIDEGVIKDLFSKKVKPDSLSYSSESTTDWGYILSKKSPEEYLIALLLRSSLAPFDRENTLLYNLEQIDFINSKLYSIFVSVRDYLGENKNFDIKKFTATISSNLEDGGNAVKDLISELYLWDLGIIVNEPEKLVKEINATFARIKKDTAKRELKKLTKQIKQAEFEKNTKLLKELSDNFNKLSENLNQYEQK